MNDGRPPKFILLRFKEPEKDSKIITPVAEGGERSEKALKTVGHVHAGANRLIIPAGQTRPGQMAALGRSDQGNAPLPQTRLWPNGTATDITGHRTPQAFDKNRNIYAPGYEGANCIYTRPESEDAPKGRDDEDTQAGDNAEEARRCSSVPSGRRNGVCAEGGTAGEGEESTGAEDTLHSRKGQTQGG